MLDQSYCECTRFQSRNCVRLLTDTFDSRDIKKKKVSMMFCWLIWKSRNELVWKQKGMEIAEVVESANVVLSQWQYA